MRRRFQPGGLGSLVDFESCFAMAAAFHPTPLPPGQQPDTFSEAAAIIAFSP